MSVQDLESKFGMKNSLHRKKLRLAMRAKMETSSPANLVKVYLS
jgi:hypothetical protein